MDPPATPSKDTASPVVPHIRGQLQVPEPSSTDGPRARSSSPWASGVSTPTSTHGGWARVPPFGTGMPVRAGVGAGNRGYEGSVMAAVRRQMEAFEERISGQITRALQQAERTQERLDAKVTAMEGMQPKVDRRLAELNGNLKGLNDEVQSQVQTREAVDARLRDWRRELQEDWRQRATQFEQAIQGIESSTRVASASSEDQLKRQNLKFRRVEERIQQTEDAFQQLMSFNLGERLEELEYSFAQESRHAADKALLDTNLVNKDDTGPSLWQLRQQLQDLEENVSRLSATTLEAQTRVDSYEVEHEVRLSSIRAKLDAHVEQHGALKDRIERAGWDSQHHQQKQEIQEQGQKLMETRERVEVLGKTAEHMDQVVEELIDQVRQLLKKGAAQESMMNMNWNSGGGEQGIPYGAVEDAGAAPMAMQAFVDALDGITASTQLLESRMDELFPLRDVIGGCVDQLHGSHVATQLLEQRMGLVESDLKPLKTDSLAPRVHVLIQQLKEVAPKVIAHDQQLKMLCGGSPKKAQGTDAT